MSAYVYVCVYVHISAGVQASSIEYKESLL